jgi:MFS family permease
MKHALTLFSGIFLVMALSNAVVPVLPAFAKGSSLQGAVYAAYFLGAFLSTLPAGLLSDRFGRAPLIRAGFFITLASGFFLSVLISPHVALAARFMEGIGAGCFVAAAMSYVNSRPDHTQASGYFMALLNAGLVLGLVLAGWLAQYSGYPAAGLLLFTSLTVFPAGASLFMKDSEKPSSPFTLGDIIFFAQKYCRLWFSSVTLVGITGVVSSLYPQFSGASSERLGFWIAGMSAATICTVLAVSRFPLPPLAAIRWSAALMAFGVAIAFFSPFGFAVLGGLAGIVMIAQMSYLAGEGEHQGLVMGLFSTMSYLGMAILPFIAGLAADMAGFPAAFGLTALFAVITAVVIGGIPPPKARGAAQ